MNKQQQLGPYSHNLPCNNLVIKMFYDRQREGIPSILFAQSIVLAAKSHYQPENTLSPVAHLLFPSPYYIATHLQSTRQ